MRVLVRTLCRFGFLKSFLNCSTARTVNHPFHLHGYDVFVLGMGQRSDGVPMTIELAKAMMKHKELERSSLRRHAIKDTISVPIRGYTIFRFKADNPGWWLLHCHYGEISNLFFMIILS